MKRIFAAFSLLLILTGCAAKPSSYTADFFAMDTFMSITAYDADEDAAREAAFACEQQVNSLEPALSRTREDSDLYRLNHADGAVCTVSDETYAAIEAAVKYAELTDGAFDPTMAVLTDLWGIGTEQAHVPAQAEIDAALAKVGYGNIVLLGDNQVQLKNGAQIDLGGIGKGFATDAVADVLAGQSEESVSGALVQLGGNIGAFGENPARKGGGWSIGVADPDDNADFIATVEVRDQSVVTSGDYERYFEQDGKRYHHIFDPATGYPADTGLRSVTVIDENSTRADALTTALFVMGLDEGMAFCAENGIAAVFVTSDKQVYTTDAVASACTYTFLGEDKGYSDAQQA